MGGPHHSIMVTGILENFWLAGGVGGFCSFKTGIPCGLVYYSLLHYRYRSITVILRCDY